MLSRPGAGPPAAPNDRVPDLCAPGAARRLLRSFEDTRKILLAVSGGPDSVAMMLLARDFLDALAAEGRDAPQIHVATVDHGLRAASRHEAETVAQWAHAAGFAHDILTWSAGRPGPRLQERAREARYGLLFSCAARIGARIVATAHHADDQAETILFRLLRGSGVAGLAGMAERLPRCGLIHARPLLVLAKADLSAFCAARSHPFFADPSNLDPAFARTRMRALAVRLAEEGFDRAALLRLGRRAARAEEALARRACAVADAVRLSEEPGRITFDLLRAEGEPEEILLRVIAAPIVALSGPAPLRLERLEALASRLLQALTARRSFAATLSGAALKLDAAGRLTLTPAKPRGVRVHAR